MNHLVVGTGFYGATFARLLAEDGHKVYLIDKRNHIGGNCFTQKIHGIDVHKYGPHAFHTNSEKVWEFLNRFSEFNDFKLKVKVNYKNNFYSFPINLFTLNQIYGIVNEKEAKSILNKITIKNTKRNFKNYILSNVGREIYEIFYEGYTKKQWNIDPKNLPESLAKRIPIRFDFNDYYFTDKYQGIPINGYTNLFENMIDHKNIKVETGINFFDNKKELEKKFKSIIYSGKIDELFDYRFGQLDYRSLKFVEQEHQQTFQGNSIINYTSFNVPYTRIVEHKYFTNKKTNKTIITYEYPEKYNGTNECFYPIGTNENKKIYLKYKEFSELNFKYIIGGRLGKYTYLNMDQTIAMAIKNYEEQKCQKKKKIKK